MGHGPDKNIGIIHTKFGQMGTPNPQATSDIISEGKNPGKKNETSPVQQAEKEAKSKWQKQLDSGYVESLDRAEAGENDLMGVECMLAHSYGIFVNKVFEPDQCKKIKFPAAIQPKFDGIRSLTQSDCSLWSREHKPIKSVPHIEEEIKSVFPRTAPPLDGEMYNHLYKHEFEKITSIVTQKTKVSPDHKIVQYHIYDLALTDIGFWDRHLALEEMLKDSEFLIPVPTEIVNSHEEIVAAFEKYRALGYEGIMVRNLDAPYEGKRSYNLLKLKEFFEEEFEIIGAEEGRGKLIGHLAAFICKTKDGAHFKASMKCTQARKKELLETKEQHFGKMLTVRFQGYTVKNKVPRFPEGIRFREAGF